MNGWILAVGFRLVKGRARRFVGADESAIVAASRAVVVTHIIIFIGPADAGRLS
jgi:hypothetical protein